MRRIFLPWLLSVPLAAAWTGISLPQVGYNLPGPGLTEASEYSFEQAGRHPNFTNSIHFTRTYDNQTEHWAWRVNITDLRVPNFYQELGQALANASEGRHLINTQWQLQWPIDTNGDGLHDGLVAYLRRRDLAMYANFFQIDVPSEVASRYSPRYNGDCAPILGVECVNALKKEASGGGPVYYHGIEDCSQLVGESFGTSTGYAPPLNTSEFELYPKDTMYYMTSNTFDIGSLTPLYRAEGVLQLLIMDFQPNMKNENVNISSPSVLCQIVDKSKAGSAASMARPLSAAALLGLTTLSVLIGTFL